MYQNFYLSSLRRHAAWLLFVGLLAVALNALAGAGVMLPGAGSGGKQYAGEVCTSHGLMKIDPAQTGTADPQPASGAHDCCKQCATGGPLLAMELGNAVSPAPTFGALRNRYAPARPALVAWTAHPPRGPPASA